MRFPLPAVLVLSLACGGGAPAPQATEPAESPEAVVTRFLRAVADSNIVGITELWGTEKGSAARTGQPPEYRRRAVIMQSYLRHESARIVSTVPVVGDPNRLEIQVELARRGCVKQVPFTTVRSGAGWLVTAVDLDAAGSPARACDPRRN